MPLSQSQASVLDELLTTLPSDGTWCLFGSVDSVLRGLDDEPSDVDVLATASGAQRIRDAFSDSFVRTRSVDGSRIDEYRLRGEDVEVVYCDRSDGAGAALVDLGAIDLDAVDLETVGERAVPVLPLPELLEVYRRIGKDDTAARLVDRLSGEL